MNELTEFSVIVPIYKVEPYLRQCIESILNQTYGGFELILVDDGSPDDCGKICDEYAQEDERVKVIHQKNSGVTVARKAGVSEAAGEYVCWVDGDDYIGSDLLRTMHDIIAKQKPDMIAYGFKQVRDDGTVIRTAVNDLPCEKLYKTQDAGFYDLLIYNRNASFFNCGSILPSLWTKVAKREIIVPNMLAVPELIAMGEDVAVTNATLCSCNSVYIANTCEYYYRSNEASMTNTFKLDMLRRRQVLFEFMNSHMDKIPQANKDAYACQQILGHIAGAVRNFDSYSEFSKYIRAEMTPELHEIVDRCEIPKLSLKHTLLFVLLKHYAYGGFWMIYHVRKQH